MKLFCNIWLVNVKCQSKFCAVGPNYFEEVTITEYRPTTNLTQSKQIYRIIGLRVLQATAFGHFLPRKIVITDSIY